MFISIKKRIFFKRGQKKASICLFCKRVQTARKGAAAQSCAAVPFICHFILKNSADRCIIKI